MHKDQKWAQEELQPTHTNVNETDKPNYHLVTNEKVDENSPFRLVGQEGTGYFIALANYRLTDFYETAEEAVSLLGNTNWTMIANLIVTMMRINEERKYEIDQD